MNLTDLPADVLNLTILNVPVSTWVIFVMIAGRIYSSARKGGGVVGIVRGFLFGENTPPAPKS